MTIEQKLMDGISGPIRVYTVKGKSQVAVLFGSYVHPITDSTQMTYCGIVLYPHSQTGVAEEFDCPKCAGAMR